MKPDRHNVSYSILLTPEQLEFLSDPLQGTSRGATSRAAFLQGNGFIKNGGVFLLASLCFGLPKTTATLPPWTVRSGCLFTPPPAIADYAKTLTL